MPGSEPRGRDEVSRRLGSSWGKAARRIKGGHPSYYHDQSAHRNGRKDECREIARFRDVTLEKDSRTESLAEVAPFYGLPPVDLNLRAESYFMPLHEKPDLCD